MQKNDIQFNQEGFPPDFSYKKMVPLKLVVKFEPPLIGLLYKRNEKKKKKHIYNILLNSLLTLPNAEEITKQLFVEHCFILNPNVISFDQVQKLVQKILDHFAEGGEHMDDEEQMDEEEYNEALMRQREMMAQRGNQDQRIQGGYEEEEGGFEGEEGDYIDQNIDFENLDDIDEELLEAAFQQNVAAGGTTDKMEFLKDLVMAQRRHAAGMGDEEEEDGEIMYQD